MLCHARKMFSLGFIVSGNSIKEIENILVRKTENPFKYVLTYKFSQDNLELCFSCIRTEVVGIIIPIYYKWALRRLLFRHNDNFGGNYLNSDSFPSGSVFEFCSQNRSLSDTSDEDYSYSLIINEASNFSHSSLSEFQDKYIRLQVTL